MTDSVKQRGQQWLESLLQLAGVSAPVKATEERSASKSEDEQVKNYWLTIDAANLSAEQITSLIGDRGAVLDGMQYLANATLNLSQEQQAFYTIELNGYRAKRLAELQEIAQSAAQKVLASGEEVEIASLSSAERRQIHTILQDYADLETFSKGKEPHRHLVVRRLQPASGY